MFEPITYEDFITKLDNSPMGKKHQALVTAQDALRPVRTNPQTHADIAEANRLAAKSVIAVNCGMSVQFVEVV